MILEFQDLTPIGEVYLNSTGKQLSVRINVVFFRLNFVTIHEDLITGIDPWLFECSDEEGCIVGFFYVPKDDDRKWVPSYGLCY